MADVMANPAVERLRAVLAVSEMETNKLRIEVQMAELEDQLSRLRESHARLSDAIDQAQGKLRSKK